MQYNQVRRLCVIGTAAESNIGPSGPGSNGHRSIEGLVRFRLSCEIHHLAKHYDNRTGLGQAKSKVCI